MKAPGDSRPTRTSFFATTRAAFPQHMHGHWHRELSPRGVAVEVGAVEHEERDLFERPLDGVGDWNLLVAELVAEAVAKPLPALLAVEEAQQGPQKRGAWPPIQLILGGLDGTEPLLFCF